MLRCQVAAVEVVAPHRAIQLSGQLAAPNHKGNLPASQVVLFLVVIPQYHHKESPHPARLIKLSQKLKLGGRKTRKQQVEILLGQLVSQVTQHGHKEGVCHVLTNFVLVGNDHADGSVFA